MKKIFIITGEASGDLHGRNLIQALHSKDSTLQIHAVGGPMMRQLRTESFTSIAHLNATGLTEVFKLLPQYLHFFGKIAHDVKRIQPDLVVFVDNPGFNLRLAKKIKTLNIPMVYYICPQIWAWNQKRVHLMKQLFRKCLVIFDFEKDFFEKAGASAVWVGHPLIDEVELNGALDKVPNPNKKILLMPGSRINEVNKLLPVLLEAAQKIKARHSNVDFTLIQANTISDGLYNSILSKFNIPIKCERNEKYQHMQTADLALLCSGTATLECTLYHLPMIVVNKASWLTYQVAKAVIKVPYLALPNLLANKMVVPELMQNDCNPTRLFEETHRLLSNDEHWTNMRDELGLIRSRLGNKGSKDRAAQEIIGVTG